MNLDIEYYSYINLLGGELRLPLHIHISKIKDSSFYTIPNYADEKLLKIDFIEKGENIEYVRDETPHFFYGKFQGLLISIWQLEILYEFIDFKAMKYVPNLEKWVLSKNEFIQMFLESGVIDNIELNRVFYELTYYMQKIRLEFDELVIQEIGLNTEFPQIRLDDPNEPPSEYKPFMSYNRNLVDLQTALEYTGCIYFEENRNRCYNDYSWREKELRRLYTTQKTRIDNFCETVKAKMFEIRTSKNE